MSNFKQAIAPYVEQELHLAAQARENNQPLIEFQYLENAHVLGQGSTYHHVKVHVLMLLWGVRQRSFRELWGQLFRIIGAATKTAVGLVPSGNTGGSNISPFATLPLKPEHAAAIISAKQL